MNFHLQDQDQILMNFHLQEYDENNTKLTLYNSMFGVIKLIKKIQNLNVGIDLYYLNGIPVDLDVLRLYAKMELNALYNFKITKMYTLELLVPTEQAIWLKLKL